MHIISQEYANNQEREGRIFNFFETYSIASLLRKCGANKEKGVSVVAIFRYLLCLMFSDRSMYMQLLTNHFRESFSKNTVYRFLNSSKINWERFLLLLSERIVNRFLRPLTSDDREDVFIIDDSTYRKRGYKKTELVTKVFDHVSMKYIKGFRLLTLCWSDGNSLVPVAHRLMSSANEENILGVVNDYDKRSLAFKRRQQACCKATDVTLDMLKDAQKAGHKAKYVLFDSWFSNPKEVIRIKEECGPDTIAMIKKTTKTYYEYNGEKLNIKRIFCRCKKQPEGSKYIVSAIVNARYTDEKGVEHKIPAKIVCVRNRSNKKDWLAMICTNTELSEEEIIRIYGKRWDIEVFFKTCKQMLKLETECRSLSYDALTAHVSIVFVRYMLLSVEKRTDEDDRTTGELFWLIADELQDITFNESLKLVVQAFVEAVAEKLHITASQLDSLMTAFCAKLPAYIRSALCIPITG